MTTELPKTYDPASAQKRWVEHWLNRGYCNADPTPGREQHTIMIPLPNVTGALHMGHCLNGTIQDLLTRWRRMQGRVALWMPGTDHAGIATQAVVNAGCSKKKNSRAMISAGKHSSNASGNGKTNTKPAS